MDKARKPRRMCCRTKSLPECIREFLTPAVWKQARQEASRRKMPRWDVHPLCFVLLAMTWCCGDSLPEKFETARGFYVACRPKRRLFPHVQMDYGQTEDEFANGAMRTSRGGSVDDRHPVVAGARSFGDAGSQRQRRSGCLQPSPSTAGDSPGDSRRGLPAASPAFRNTPSRMPSRTPRPQDRQGKTRLASSQAAQAAWSTPNPHAHQSTKTPIITMSNSRLAIKSVDGIEWHCWLVRRVFWAFQFSTVASWLSVLRAMIMQAHKKAPRKRLPAPLGLQQGNFTAVDLEATQKRKVLKRYFLLY